MIALVAILGTSACKKKKDDSLTPVASVIKPVVPVDTTMIAVSANNPDIQYIGRIDFSNAMAPPYSFQDVSIKAKFQ